MKSLSLKLEDNIFEEIEKIVSRNKKIRNRYINEALEFYNLHQNHKLLSKQPEKESKLVREESMKVLAEFEELL